MANYEQLYHAGDAPVATLTISIDDNDLSFTVSDGTGFPTGRHYVMVDPTTDLDNPNTSAEKMLVTRSGNTFTVVTRGVDDTTGIAHSSGAKVIHVMTALEAHEANDAVRYTIGLVSAAGDMIIGSAANVFSRLAKGSDGQVLRMASGAVGWGALPADSVGSSQIATNAVNEAEIGDAELKAIAGLVSAADKFPYFTGSGTAALGTVTSFARDFLDDTTAASALSTLGITAFVQTLLDDTTASAFLTTLGVSAFAKTLIDDADAATARATLGFSGAGGSADTAQIADNAVTNAKMADDSVDSAEIVDGAVDIAHHASFTANTVLEGPLGDGTPVATERGRSWAREMTSDSGGVDTTPTQVAGLNIDAPALKEGRRYRMEFSGQMLTTTGTGRGYVQFRKNGNLYDKRMTSLLSSLTTDCQTMITYYEPASDETVDWDIYLEAITENVRIEAAATQKAVFIITDVGLAVNA
jgi:hypothetical protein